MRINETNRTGMINAYNKTPQAKGAGQVKGKMGKDEVQISTEALELLKLGEDLELTSARKAKIQELKQQVEKGTYQVPSQKIAEKLINFWKKP
ncbi:flagellar biosynthesis anti-sigma factor FlgM [Brevibacillus dissolubilis]|uniref:flagellar biosynthesis anti-sigma factor FlgM n=1 Tax=Brevibacillus dissolubilis TaxID=1844116 RepID=UPI00111615E5|nr:flagellar biosynthesis anti-sigma factor FlgM [Brevibacillus dissolubilis]